MIDEIVKKIDERISELAKIVETTTGETCVTATARVNELFTTKRLILAEQKEPCEECIYRQYKGTDIYTECKYCKNYDGFIQRVTLTKGDVIRESNESLSGFIRGQFGDDRVFHKGNTVDLDEFLNQPQEDTNE